MGKAVRRVSNSSHVNFHANAINALSGNQILSPIERIRCRRENPLRNSRRCRDFSRCRPRTRSVPEFGSHGVRTRCEILSKTARADRPGLRPGVPDAQAMASRPAVRSWRFAAGAAWPDVNGNRNHPAHQSGPRPLAPEAIAAVAEVAADTAFGIRPRNWPARVSDAGALEAAASRVDGG